MRQKPSWQTQQPRIGRSGRLEYTYIRHGALSLLASFVGITEKVYADCRERRTTDDLMEFMAVRAKGHETARKIIVIGDTLHNHPEGASHRWTEFNARHGKKFECHYTPSHGVLG